jgi:ketosteroid isomerase-like protein
VSENLDLVRSIYAAWELGDFSSIEWAHPEIEYVRADGPAPGLWSGLGAMGQAVRDDLVAWKEFRIEAEAYREVDPGRVLVLVRYGGRGKASGVDLRQMRTHGADLFHVREGKVTRRVVYWDRERALADLGLAEQERSS